MNAEKQNGFFLDAANVMVEVCRFCVYVLSSKTDSLCGNGKFADLRDTFLTKRLGFADLVAVALCLLFCSIPYLHLYLKITHGYSKVATLTYVLRAIIFKVIPFS